MFFFYEGMFKTRWILKACLAFSNVISQSVLQAFLLGFFSIEAHEIGKYHYSYSSRKLEPRNKNKLRVNPEFFTCSNFSRCLTCTLSIGVLCSFLRDQQSLLKVFLKSAILFQVAKKPLFH